MDKKITCEYCKKEFSKYGIKNHIAIIHEGKIERVQGKKGKKGKSWNKGLTKNESKLLRKISLKISKSLKGVKRKPLSKEHREKISLGMKKAHKEEKAWNIGKSRWNNEPSYPESFFMKVIENHFEDKNYIKEHPVGIYSIDFAWIDKKKAIEIDGCQHERFKEYKNRDIRKDKFLKENNWKVLRIKWKDFFNETKTYINIAYNFIHN